MLVQFSSLNSQAIALGVVHNSGSGLSCKLWHCSGVKLLIHSREKWGSNISRNVLHCNLSDGKF